MKVIVEQYTIEHPRWKSPSIRTRCRIEFCCPEARSKESAYRFQPVKTGVSFEIFSDDDGMWYEQFMIIFCPFCGKKTEVRENG